MKFRLFNHRLGALRCPYCREEVGAFQLRRRRYGSPLRTCPFCGERFIDKDYLEPFLAPRGIAKIPVGHFIVAIILIINLIVDIHSFIITHNVDIGLVGVANTVYLAVTQNPDKAFVGGLLLVLSLFGVVRSLLYKPTPREMKLSKERLQEPDYIFALSDAGYDVPEETLNWAYEHSGRPVIHQDDEEEYLHSSANHQRIYLSSPDQDQLAPKPNNQRSCLVRFFIFAMLFFVVLTAAHFITQSETEDLPPVTEPQSGEFLSGFEYENSSELTISASGGESCLVKLKTASGITRCTFYVRAGDIVTVGIPNERLYVYFATGKTWYGEEHLFGKYTSYSMDDEICDFENYTWEYTLYPVSDGNFTETPISADEFN